MSSKLKALIFDMDGLLVDTEPLYEQVWKESLAEFGFAHTHALQLQLIGRGRKGALEKVQEFFGPTLDIEMLSRELSVREERFFRENTPNLKPGAEELLSYSKQRGFGLALATSTRRVVTEIRLERTGLKSWFPVTVCGDEVKQGKPAPDIFLSAASKLGAESGSCLVLEDSPSGIQGAAAAGMKAIMVPDLLQPSAETRNLATQVLADLYAVQAWLERS